MMHVAFLVVLLAAVPVRGQSVGTEDLIQRYQDLLLLTTADYQMVDVANTVFQDHLLPQFSRAVRDAQSYSYDYRGVPAYYERSEPARTEEEKALEEANRRFLRFFRNTLPMLAYAYQTPGPSPGANPHYQNNEVLALYLDGLDYCYSRGLTEDAWIIDNAGSRSGRAMEQGLVRTSGDFSTEILRLGGFIQSIFLMREPLAENGLLDKYRAVVRNLAVNNGAMYAVFYQIARSEVAGSLTTPLPFEERHYLNADGIRLFADYFFPYFLLIEDVDERDQMTSILREVIGANIAVKPGVQGTIKPDGTGYHHATAYVGAYSPFAYEAMAQLLYLLRGTGWYRSDNVDALKFALQSYRVMVQRYTVSTAFRGRLIKGSSESPSVAVAKAMAFLAHPDGVDDPEMRARFAEFFDTTYFFEDSRLASLYQGQRSISIRGLGSLRLIAGLQSLPTQAEETPAGVWIKPYAAGAFFRRDNWLVTAKGFSQYFWDYEGPLDTGENSLGQNWAYGLLQVFSAGQPVSERGSGYDYFNGWDWYHVPGTTASHYPIEKRTSQAVQQARQEHGIVQRSTHRNYNNKTFVGGVSIGGHGLFVQDLEAVPFTAPTDLQARKSYFFVGDKVLALGTHIRGGTDEDETHTTIFQTRLASADTPTGANGDQAAVGETPIRQPAGSTMAMSDSVGNSYFLASSTSDLFLSRQVQQSLSPDYEPTEGAFVQAYLNHGIKPLGDSYQYVVIPADPDGLKLQALAANPSDYYQVVEDGNIHLVYFPEQQITGYAFFELAETPNDQLVRRVNLPAVVMTQEDSDGVTLAASVPDIGWQFDSAIVSRGLSYASNHFKRQEAKVHLLELSLRGNWRLAEDVEGVWLHSTSNGTTLLFKSTDGLSYLVRLTPAGGSEPPNLTPSARECPAGSPTWMGLPVCEEGTRAGYDPDAFGAAYISLEDEIISGLPQSDGQVYTPYTCTPFDILADGTAATDIDHIVALAEAYDSGLAESQFQTFAGDIDNLTIADPVVKRTQKADRDAGEWGPPRNSGWFAARVVAVKQKYGLSVNPAERDVLQAMLNSDPSRTVTCGEGLTPTGGPTYYFPHLAVGASWQTTITYINYSPEEVICQTEFLSDQGSPLVVSFAGRGTVVSRTDVLLPWGSVHEETNVELSAPLAPGWARATCSGPVKASLLFRWYNSEGVPVAEAAVNATTVPATRFITFAEQGEGKFGTGVAYANPSSTAALITFTARDADGHTLASVDRTLLSGGHYAENMVDLFDLSSFTGSLEITSTEPIVSLSLNFEADPVFSSLPPGEVDATAQGSTTYYFPHLAVGEGWQTTMTYINYSPQEVSCQTEFLSDHGSPLMVSFATKGTVVSRDDVLPPGGSVHQESNVELSAPLAPGWARATCSGPVKASLLYRLHDSEGLPTGEAAVNAATVPATRFVTFAEQGEGKNGTGVAYANPSDTSAMLTFTAKDADGETLASVVRTLLPNGHDAQNMALLFGLSSFTRSLEITSTEPIVSLSLNFEAAPVFSSLPPGELDLSVIPATGREYTNSGQELRR